MKTLKLDWELASNFELHEEELRRWEKEVYDLEDERADLIIGADIVRFFLSLARLFTPFSI